MLRIRFNLPHPLPAQTYSHQDLIHDAIINALAATGIEMDTVLGRNAKLWTFAPLGWHRGHTGFMHSLILSTSDLELARAFTKLKADQLSKRRWNGESINFSGAQISLEPDPFFPKQTQLACLLLSPLVLRNHSQATNKHWHTQLNGLDLSEMISRQLSAKAGREIRLNITPDSLYLRANPKHSVLINLKQHQGGQKSFVIGMQAHLLLEGSEDDLRFAWYAGIGEKTRNGFGCLGLLEQGVS